MMLESKTNLTYLEVIETILSMNYLVPTEREGLAGEYSPHFVTVLTADWEQIFLSIRQAPD